MIFMTKTTKVVCISCKTDVTNQVCVKFKCPSCDKEEIIRCNHCRRIATSYVCGLCGFSGPN